MYSWKQSKLHRAPGKSIPIFIFVFLSNTYAAIIWGGNFKWSKCSHSIWWIFPNFSSIRIRTQVLATSCNKFKKIPIFRPILAKCGREEGILLVQGFAHVGRKTSKLAWVTGTKCSTGFPVANDSKNECMLLVVLLFSSTVSPVFICCYDWGKQISENWPWIRRNAGSSYWKTLMHTVIVLEGKVSQVAALSRNKMTCYLSGER